MSRCTCRACGQNFNAESTFDRHRVGDYDLNAPGYGRTCLTTQEMKAKGWLLNGDGYWVTAAWDKNYRFPLSADRCRSAIGGDQDSEAAESVAA